MKKGFVLCIVLMLAAAGVAFAFDCPHCGRWNSDDARFCGHCGQSVRPVQAVSCGQCGWTNPRSTSYCIKCGYPIISQAQPFYGPGKPGPYQGPPPNMPEDVGPYGPAPGGYNVDVFFDQKDKKKKKGPEWRSMGHVNLDGKGAIEFPVNATIHKFRVVCIEGTAIVNVFVVRTPEGNRDFTIGQRLKKGDGFERNLGGPTAVTGFRWGDNGKGKLEVFVK